MKFKELNISELEKEIKNFLNTKTPDEIINVLEDYLYFSKLQLLYDRISYLYNGDIDTEIENSIEIEMKPIEYKLDYKQGLTYNNSKVSKKIYSNFNDWECGAA